jgi:hypothetical protein
MRQTYTAIYTCVGGGHTIPTLIFNLIGWFKYQYLNCGLFIFFGLELTGDKYVENID